MKLVAWEKVSLVIHKILTLFVKTWTVDENYYLLNRDNLMQPIQTQLSRKQKTFSYFFFTILKVYIKFQTFSKER